MMVSSCSKINEFVRHLVEPCGSLRITAFGQPLFNTCLQNNVGWGNVINSVLSLQNEIIAVSFG